MKVNQLKAGVILSYGYTFIQTIILLFYTPIMIRMLGKSEYGLYSLVYSTVSYLAVLNVGFGSAFVRYYSRYKALGKEEKIENLNGMFLIIFCILGLIALICGSVDVYKRQGIRFGTKLYKDGDEIIGKEHLYFQLTY